MKKKKTSLSEWLLGNVDLSVEGERLDLVAWHSENESFFSDEAETYLRISVFKDDHITVQHDWVSNKWHVIVLDDGTAVTCCIGGYDETVGYVRT